MSNITNLKALNVLLLNKIMNQRTIDPTCNINQIKDEVLGKKKCEREPGSIAENVQKYMDQFQKIAEYKLASRTNERKPKEIDNIDKLVREIEENCQIAEFAISKKPAIHHESKDPEEEIKILHYNNENSPFSPVEEIKKTVPQPVIVAQKIEQIETLKDSLKEDGVNLDVKKVTADSSIEDINNVLEILEEKNKKHRYSNVIEDLMLGAANLIGKYFNGKREIPYLGIRPNYKGYQHSLGPRLRRLKPETSVIVENVMSGNNFGPMAKFFCEILPSFLLFPINNDIDTPEDDFYKNYIDVSSQLEKLNSPA